MREITIKPALNGYVVRTGCQRLVFNSRTDMLAALNAYLDEPEKIESEFMFNSMNSKQLGFIKERIEPGELREVDESTSHED